MVGQFLAQLDSQQNLIDTLTARIEQMIAPFAATRDRLTTIPGISTRVAEPPGAEGADGLLTQRQDQTTQHGQGSVTFPPTCCRTGSPGAAP